MAIKHDAILGRSNLYNVDPREIQVIDGWNPRADFSGEDELMASIIENGVKRPLEVKKVGDNIFLVDGERRLRATLRAISEGNEILSVPCLFCRPNISDSEALFDALIANDGKPLDPIEEAEAFQRLKGWGLSVAQIAKKIGKSTVHVYRRLALVDASEDLKREIKEKNITLLEAENIIKESTGNIETQRKKISKTRKAMRVPEIKKLLKEKEAMKDKAMEVADRAWNDGYVAALRKVLWG